MDTHEKRNNRRQFLKGAGISLVAIQVLPLISRAEPPAALDTLEESDRPAHLPELTGQTLKVGSGLGYIPHRHELLIPLQLLQNPSAQGVQLKTEWTAFHFHSVNLTYEQLKEIADGGVVEVKDSTVGEHVFLIYIPEE